MTISVDVLKLETGRHTILDCSTKSWMTRVNSSISFKGTNGLGEMPTVTSMDATYGTSCRLDKKEDC